jgi:predicted TIM-barrel fold metal-dependent hydrolase
VLDALNRASGETFFQIPEEATHADEAAAQAFDRGREPFVIDVQTHLVNPLRWGAVSAQGLADSIAMFDPDRWSGGIDPELLSAACWARHIFGESETNIALLTSLPGRDYENVLTNQEIAACRDLTERYAGTGRVLTHTIVHPNLGQPEIDGVHRWSEEQRPAGWKVYPLWDPPEVVERAGSIQGWLLDDEKVGLPFLEAVRSAGPHIVCAHKGIAGLIGDSSPTGSSPKDIGPASRLFPDIAFVVYHSGYEVDPDTEEGPYDGETRGRGVNRLVASLEESGVSPGSNVYAELGTTWYLAAKRPREAAHILGKLLLAVGEDRVLWGTDSIWYGSPQPLIDAFWSFQIPEELQARHGYPSLTAEIKQKILWKNAAYLYQVPADDLKGATSPLDREKLTQLERALGGVHSAPTSSAG